MCFLPRSKSTSTPNSATPRAFRGIWFDELCLVRHSRLQPTATFVFSAKQTALNRAPTGTCRQMAAWTSYYQIRSPLTLCLTHGPRIHITARLHHLRHPSSSFKHRDFRYKSNDKLNRTKKSGTNDLGFGHGFGHNVLLRAGPAVTKDLVHAAAEPSRSGSRSGTSCKSRA